MSPLSSLAAAGRSLIERADRRLAESAHTFMRAAETAESPASDGTTTGAPERDVVDAAVGVIYGRSAFAMGVTLIAVGRDTERLLLDIVA